MQKVAKILGVTPMKKNALTALNLFMKFVGNIGMTYQAAHFNGNT